MNPSVCVSRTCIPLLLLSIYSSGWHWRLRIYLFKSKLCCLPEPKIGLSVSFCLCPSVCLTPSFPLSHLLENVLTLLSMSTHNLAPWHHLHSHHLSPKNEFPNSFSATAFITASDPFPSESHIIKHLNIPIRIKTNPYNVLQDPGPLTPRWALLSHQPTLFSHTDPFVHSSCNTPMVSPHQGLTNHHPSVYTSLPPILIPLFPSPLALAQKPRSQQGFITTSVTSSSWVSSLICPNFGSFILYNVLSLL